MRKGVFFFTFLLGQILCPINTLASPDGDRFFEILTSNPPPENISTFLSRIPQSWKENSVIVPNSFSLQKGTRFILRNPGSSLTFSFNIDPSKSGFGTLEVRDFDEKSRSYRLSEVTFKSDAEKTGGKDLSYQKGIHINKDVAQDCVQCHRIQGARFDLRDYLPTIRPSEAKMKGLSEWLASNRENPMIKNLTFPKELNTGNPAELSKYLTKNAQNFYGEQALFQAKLVAAEVEKSLGRRPDSAFGLLSILKDCDFPSAFTRETWNHNVREFGKKSTEVGVRRDVISKLLWPEKAKNPPSPQVIELFKDAFQLTLDDREEMEDKGSNLELFAKLAFFWNPIAQATGSAATVGHWAMSSHVGGHWYGNHFGEFSRELQSMLSQFIQARSGLAPTQQTCEALNRMGREAQQQFLTDLSAHAPSPEDHD